MSGFPISNTPTAEEQKRIDEMTGQVDRAYGRGAFTEDTDSVFKRQNRSIGTVLAGLSMSISAVIKNIFPQTSLPEDLLSTHERWYRLQPDKSLTTAQRQARLLAHTQKRPDARLWKIAEWVKDFVDSIRKAFSRVDATPEAKAIMQTVNGALKYSDTIINLWDTMAVTEAQGRADVKPATVARRDVQAV